MSCWPSARGTATGGRWSRWSNGTTASVRRLAGYLLPNPQDAEDATQESLAKLCTRIGQFRGEARFATWLYSLVSNTCRDLGERQRRRAHQPLEAVADVPADGEPIDLALQREQRSSWPRSSPTCPSSSGT